ncbi:MAG TPA: peptidyl-alpha-hydroxyglycine alpha-amidating lyase family protein [Vicinamibacterales bacterium]|nr:peptidyl-alpha-hydroxyglycine alpha-amidating lyase family protein [Vicinamibacterales bacterium]
MERVRLNIILGAAFAGAVSLSSATVWAQTAVAPTNDASNPYQTVEGFFKMPEGRTWGSTSAVDVAPDGKTIWVAERCGANRCVDAKGEPSPHDIVLKFDQSGKLLASFGKGMFVFPHGIHVDREGNVWVTDGSDNMPRRAPGQPADAPMPAPPSKVIGNQVYKFSPDGKLLLALGKPGGNQPGQPHDPASFTAPNDIQVLPNGDIFVAEGHSDAPTASNRIIRFNRDGKHLGEFGKRGTGPGEFIQPHALALDAQGNLVVGDRSNNRIQILTTDGKFIREFHTFSRPSGVAVVGDMLYVADSESGSVTRDPADRTKAVRTEWTRGIRVGSLKDGKIVAFIPDPQKDLTSGTLAAEGVAVDAAGNIYGAEVGPRKLQKYTRK